MFATGKCKAPLTAHCDVKWTRSARNERPRYGLGIAIAEKPYSSGVAGRTPADGSIYRVVVSTPKSAYAQRLQHRQSCMSLNKARG